MSKQYLRKCSLLVGNPASALDLGELRIQFIVVKGTIETPNAADITVFNLSTDTVNIIQKEYDRVVLQAGYDGNFGTIFDGTIRWKRYGRQLPTDTYLNLQAGDGDEAYSFATISQSFAAGHTQSDLYSALQASLADHGIAGGTVPTYPVEKAVRGRVLFGMTRQRLRDHAVANQSTWSIQNNKLQTTPLLAYEPGDVVVLTSRTGLVGLPQLTLFGVSAKMLLNPAIQIGRLVQIDQASVQDIKLSPLWNYAGIDLSQRPDIAQDGFYKVVWLQHTGDTRDNEWYTDIICVAVDGTQPSIAGSAGMGVKLGTP